MSMKRTALALVVALAAAAAGRRAASPLSLQRSAAARARSTAESRLASCAMQDADISFEGTAYKRVDVGSTAQWTASRPRLKLQGLFHQQPGSRLPADVGAAAGPVGVAPTGARRANIVYPATRRGGTAASSSPCRARGRSFKEGNLKPWDKNFNASTPLESRR
jgi:hypothetical protein